MLGAGSRFSTRISDTLAVFWGFLAEAARAMATATRATATAAATAAGVEAQRDRGGWGDAGGLWVVAVVVLTIAAGPDGRSPASLSLAASGQTQRLTSQRRIALAVTLPARVLCHNCAASLRRLKGSCPHELRARRTANLPPCSRRVPSSCIRPDNFLRQLCAPTLDDLLRPHSACSTT